MKKLLQLEEFGNVTPVAEAKKYKFKDLSKAWAHVYGEDMEEEYPAFYQEVTGKYKDKVTKKDIDEIWMSGYGEYMESEYDGFYNDIKENLNEANKLKEFNKLEEANPDGTISDDEDDRMDDLLGTVEAEIDDMIENAVEAAYEIGGQFRGPGYTAKVKKLLMDKVKRMKK